MKFHITKIFVFTKKTKCINKEINKNALKDFKRIIVYYFIVYNILKSIFS